MEGVTKQEFAAYVANPTADTYLALVGKIVASSAYHPYGMSLGDLRQLINQRRFGDAVQKAREIMPGLLLSPTFHLNLSIAYQELGNQDASEAERKIYFACLQGILGTGDGSQASPYHVAYVADEYTVLFSLKKKKAKQTLISANGRHYDMQTLTDGTEIWFDITRAKSHLDRLLQMEESRAEAKPQDPTVEEAQANQRSRQNPPMERAAGSPLVGWLPRAWSRVMRLLHRGHESVS